MKTQIEVTLAGLTLPCAFRYPETAKYFPAPDPAAPCVGGEPVCLTGADWSFYLQSGMVDCAHTEFSIMTGHFSDALMPHDRMILHAVAIRHRDRAYLIAAPSGVGKSTQARFLQELRPGEFDIICGDRPALEFRKKNLPPFLLPNPVGAELEESRKYAHIGPHPPTGAYIPKDQSCSGAQCAPPPQMPSPLGEGVADRKPATEEGKLPAAPSASASGPVLLPPHVVDKIQRRKKPEEWDVIVHPTPWNGKENWYGASASPLAGLILLERGEENKLCVLSPRQAALPVFNQVIQTCRRAEDIRKAAELTTRLLNSVPIWKLTSFQVPDSTRLLLESVF